MDAFSFIYPLGKFPKLTLYPLPNNFPKDFAISDVCVPASLCKDQL